MSGRRINPSSVEKRANVMCTYIEGRGNRPRVELNVPEEK